MKKRVVSFVLIMLLAFSLIPAPAFAADIIASGYCGYGKKVKWVLDSDGVLTISGTGAIKPNEPYYPFNEPTFDDSLDKDSVKKIIISHGVTEIGTNSLDGFLNAKEIRISGTVERINDGGLREVGADNIIIPRGVKYIGENVFSCNLRDLAIPASVKEIDQYAFWGCNFYDSKSKKYVCSLDNIYYALDRESFWKTYYPWDDLIVGPYEEYTKFNPIMHYNEYPGPLKFPSAPPTVSTNPADYVYGFMDVPKTHKFARAIHWAVAHNIAWGTSKTSFDPEGTCTRGQVVTFLWRFKGQPEPTTNNNPFTDVKESDYFYKPVLWAVEQGITAGTTPTSFSPDAKCSYAHIGTFLWRVAGEVYPENQRYSSDLWYGDALSWEIDTFKNGFLWKNIKPMANCPRGVVIQGIKDLDTYLDHLDDE